LAATHGYSLAIKLAAAVMLAGAVIVALAFEQVDFIPPDKAALEAAEAAVADPDYQALRGSSAMATVPDTTKATS
jgi:hypothetical protein